MANAEQKELWNGDSARHRVAHDARYAAMQARHTVRLLAAAGIARAHHVLDVGCGCGATARAAAERAPAGSVLGVDLSEAMLDHARERAAAAGLRNLRFGRVDAQEHPFPPAAFDVVLSQYGVMFFEDPPAAFANLRRALRPGGRLAFLCWQAPGRNDLQTVVDAALAEHLDLPCAEDGAAPGPFSLADPERVRDLLEKAALSGIRIVPVTDPLWLGADASDAATFLRGRPRLRELLAAVDPDTAERAMDAARRALLRFETSDGVLLGAASWLVTATRPTP
ncbi:class I SAM-dependent methyltransferase [Streptomyces sp. DSM 44917]|uniref:Class I SAM-dependent methyltransferase n=1 Tax=Streptomyces boetiae TaxID=3075541 RepID=A0ABU2LD93_9ACTN|nr:class I SAM-dependent methyltransferase [Streptomyces sp. DSM 44917]MDT0309546.1 class I SAM-dependent methyltransferase [Streptomyces sp. DSM 44917]